MDEVGRLGPKVGTQQPPGAVLHLPREPGELSHCLSHADKSTNIVLGIIIISYFF